MFRRDQTMCSKYVNHSRLRSQHNAGGWVCDQVMASWPSPLQIQINLGRAPIFFAIEHGFSIHNCDQPKFEVHELDLHFIANRKNQPFKTHLPYM